VEGRIKRGGERKNSFTKRTGTMKKSSARIEGKLFLGGKRGIGVIECSLAVTRSTRHLQTGKVSPKNTKSKGRSKRSVSPKEGDISKKKNGKKNAWIRR